MEHVVVSSSNIQSIAYDPLSLTLEIRFHDGSMYQYYGVPESEHAALMAAPSHGSYFAANIRRIYRYSKM
jgi:hypothetical protein